MRVLRSPEDVEQVEDAYIKRLLTQRWQQLAAGSEPIDDYAQFVLAEPGDTANDLETGCGIWITSSLFGDTRFGDPDFAPSFETLEEHAGRCFEMAHVLNDDGFMIIVIIPAADDINDELRRFCREFATPVPTLSGS